MWTTPGNIAQEIDPLKKSKGKAPRKTPVSLTISGFEVTISSIRFHFSAPVDRASAETKSNYMVGGSTIETSIEKIEPDAAATSVTVHFSKHGLALSSGQRLQVSGVQTKDKGRKIADNTTACVLADGKQQDLAEQDAKQFQERVESLKKLQDDAEQRATQLQVETDSLKKQLEQEKSFVFFGLIKTKEGRPLRNHRFEYFRADGKSLGTDSTDEEGMYSFECKVPEIVLAVGAERHKLKAEAASP